MCSRDNLPMASLRGDVSGFGEGQTGRNGCVEVEVERERVWGPAGGRVEGAGGVPRRDNGRPSPHTASYCSAQPEPCRPSPLLNTHAHTHTLSAVTSDGFSRSEKGTPRQAIDCQGRGCGECGPLRYAPTDRAACEATSVDAVSVYPYSTHQQT